MQPIYKYVSQYGIYLYNKEKEKILHIKIFLSIATVLIHDLQNINTFKVILLSR